MLSNYELNSNLVLKFQNTQTKVLFQSGLLVGLDLTFSEIFISSIFLRENRAYFVLISLREIFTELEIVIVIVYTLISTNKFKIEMIFNIKVD